jgi:DEAD/DEAH box helicase domain-containing protein
MVKIPFGIEYVKDIELTQVNLRGLPNSNHLTINKISRKLHDMDLLLVKHCGKSTSREDLTI